jgi:hypothetical protein
MGRNAAIQLIDVGAANIQRPNARSSSFMAASDDQFRRTFQRIHAQL